jgi:hypothetical protein
VNSTGRSRNGRPHEHLRRRHAGLRQLIADDLVQRAFGQAGLRRVFEGCGGGGARHGGKYPAVCQAIDRSTPCTLLVKTRCVPRKIDQYHNDLLEET